MTISYEVERLENGYAEQSMIITGLRGVGESLFRVRTDRKTEEAGPVRSRVIDKGLLYTPPLLKGG